VDSILGPFSEKMMNCTPFRKMTIFRLKQYCKTRGLFCVGMVFGKIFFVFRSNIFSFSKKSKKIDSNIPVKST